MKYYKFFLGGHDVEMSVIQTVCQSLGIPMVDKKLGWGAKASSYESEIKNLPSGVIPVLVELEVDIPLPKVAIIIDHHGDRAGEPASILQVLKLLGVEPTRHHQLVAANDVGGPLGLLNAGASSQEFDSIRSADRAAQGITPEHEAEAVRAIEASNAQALAKNGSFVFLHMAHSKCACVTDRLFPYWKHGEKILIMSEDGEINLFAPRDLCDAFSANFKGSWSGGGERQGFAGGYMPQKEAEMFVRQWLMENQ